MEEFSKILRKTDTKKRLSLPIRLYKSFPPFKSGRHTVEFEATDEKGEPWVFQCSTRKSGPYPKPVLTRGWVAFVKSKKLQIGDKLLMESLSVLLHLTSPLESGLTRFFLPRSRTLENGSLLQNRLCKTEAVPLPCSRWMALWFV
ncbi:hypothetical protein SADUNF_Sadunf15G0015200 [Salix dunnii]|uniref:TF-B3 domain-containing protein n=1 Tax=Salix dunnii TaxID=1413687 RepID=A0A835JCY8_9ROSI|nr:hypothetical protein SADUNF_Sadunf15G0015200 [Salix dunnii]